MVMADGHGHIKAMQADMDALDASAHLKQRQLPVLINAPAHQSLMIKTFIGMSWERALWQQGEAHDSGQSSSLSGDKCSLSTRLVALAALTTVVVNGD